MHNRIRQRGCGVNLTLQWIYVSIWTQSNDNELWLRTYHYLFIIIYIEKATADLEPKYRKVYVVYLHTT